MSATTADPRCLKAGAYVRINSTVYRVLGLEKDDDDDITGKYSLENIIGEYSASGTYVHRRVAVSLAVMMSYVLVKEAPSAEVPDHLEAQMRAHLAQTDLGSSPTR